MFNRRISKDGGDGITPSLLYCEKKTVDECDTNGTTAYVTKLSSDRSDRAKIPRRCPGSAGTVLLFWLSLLSALLLLDNSGLSVVDIVPTTSPRHGQQEVSVFLSGDRSVENAFVRGSRVREGYTPVPSYARRKFVAKGRGADHVKRAFEMLGWEEAPNAVQAHLYVRFKSSGADRTARNLFPFQRYGRIPGFSQRWESKDLFLDGMREYSRFTGYDMWFLPATYRLSQDPWDREDFMELLEEGSGMNYPWVLKDVDVNNGDGITMISPHSERLKGLVQEVQENSESTFLVQQYVCNELTWTSGEKFDLRMFFLVASIDPFIVLFGEGYVRAGARQYNESDWTTTGQHLTNAEFRGNRQDVTNEHLWERLRDHYRQHETMFRARGFSDPVAHVHNQIKEALGRFAAAFQPGTLADAHATHREENNFGFYGCDFIVDADLDVWFIEPQTAPGMPDQSYHLATWDRLLPPMINIIEEISIKQEEDPRQSILPLDSLEGGWEVVYAGGEIFKYHGYSRSKDKKSCVPIQIK
jgi:Tubulin-tyrosine ligase family